MNKIYIALAAILLLGLATHGYFAHWGVLYEPDDYIYLSVAQQTLANHLIIPQVDTFSHFPTHLPYGEYPGLIYMAVLPASLGIPLFDVFMYLPLLFGLLGILGAYLLGKEAFSSRAGLYSALIMALLPAAIYRGMAGEWRGGAFISVFVIFMTYLIFKAWHSGHKSVAILIPLPFMLLSAWFWSGGLYVTAIYIFSVVILLLAKLGKKAVIPISVLAISGWIYLFLFSPYASFFNYSAGITEVTTLTPINALFQYSLVLPLGIIGFVLLLKSDKPIIDRSIFLAWLIITLPLAIAAIRFTILAAAPLAILSAAALSKLSKSNLLNLIIIFSLLAPFAFLAANIEPAGISPQLVSAIQWIKNNTPENATFLTSWPDGSLIEGIAQRQSWSDSIQAQAYGFSFGKLLFARAGNLTYLYNISPDYLLVEPAFKNQSQAIAEEAGVKPIYNGSNLQAFLNTSIVQLTNNKIVAVYNSDGVILYKVN
jgi:hypothetical protein